jgi:DNA polymerase III delta subunit
MRFDDGHCYLVTMPTEQFPFYPIKRDRIRQLIDEWFEKKGLPLDGVWSH